MKVHLALFMSFFIGSFSLQAQELPTDPLRTQNIEFWIKQLRSPITDMRLTALKTLAAIRNLKAVNHILPLLNSQEPEVRFEAARSLGRLPSRESLEVLGRASSAEEDVYIKAEINRSIQLLRDFFDQMDARDASSPEEAEDFGD